jgi:hypothetical protein
MQRHKQRRHYRKVQTVEAIWKKKKQCAVDFYFYKTTMSPSNAAIERDTILIGDAFLARRTV